MAAGSSANAPLVGVGIVEIEYDGTQLQLLFEQRLGRRIAASHGSHPNANHDVDAHDGRDSSSRSGKPTV